MLIGADKMGPDGGEMLSGKLRLKQEKKWIKLDMPGVDGKLWMAGGGW